MQNYNGGLIICSFHKIISGMIKLESIRRGKYRACMEEMITAEKTLLKEHQGRHHFENST
jgi:hypothetical protein